METGEDLRFTRRPMLGIMIESEVDAVRAGQLGVPVPYGAEIGGVVPGMKAEASGLRAGDVLVNVDGADVTGFGALATALQPHRAGDRVSIVFYRQGTEHTAELELSERPLPHIPSTSAELAQFMRETNAKLNAELRASLAGIPEEDAGRKPSEDEWSAKEVVAHLLNEEGDNHSWIIELVTGAERDFDAPFGNSHLRTAVTAWSYPEAEQMLDALEHLQEQSIALVSQLPAEFEARRSSFWRLAYNFATRPDHNEEHIQQIRAALAKPAA
jgi:membrane-associated protease RseP (regulator of RpoE activity)